MPRLPQQETNPHDDTARTAFLPESPTWEEWSRIYVDTDLWDPVVREICRREVIRVTRVTSGFPGTNAVFLLDIEEGREYVIKIAPPQCREYQRTELSIGRALAGRVPVPEVVASGVFHDRTDWPWFIMTRMPGVAVREVRSHMPRNQWLMLCREAGRLVKDIHATPLSTVDGMDKTVAQSDWQRQWCEQPLNTLTRLTEEKALPEEALVRLRALHLQSMTAETEAIPDSLQPLTLVNADLTEDHLLVVEDACQWRIGALIDLADGCMAPVAYEWPALWFGLLGRDREALHAFFSGYDPAWRDTPAFWKSLLAYTLAHRFGFNMLRDAVANGATGSLLADLFPEFAEACGA